MAALERQMWELVNRDRRDPANAAETGGRAQPLKWNEKLAAVALAHSRDMVEHHYFEHIDREGRSPFMRMNALGIHWRSLAENIAINRTVADAETTLMAFHSKLARHPGFAVVENSHGPIIYETGPRDGVLEKMRAWSSFVLKRSILSGPVCRVVMGIPPGIRWFLGLLGQRMQMA